jgi:hypothetical protein
MTEFIMLAFANAAISYTISKTYIFDGIRWRLRHWDFPYFLITCPYCVSHWVAFAMVAIWQPTFTYSNYLILDLAISAFAMVMMSALIWGSFIRLITSE